MSTPDKFNEKIAKWLTAQPFWHGYIPREDLPFILKKKGDYIVRTTERPTAKGCRRELVLSIAWPDLPVAILTLKDIKNIVIERQPQRVFIDNQLVFPGIDALFEHYKKSHIVVLKTNTTIKLLKGVGLASWEYRHSHVTLIKKVGQGAYGEVYKSIVKRSKGKPFEAAIKTMKPDTVSNESKMKEIMAEARMMRMLNHPNIVRIRGIAVLEHPLYIIIDFISGGALDSYLKKHESELTMADKNNMAISAAWAIEFVHSHDILHRDIAARNCLYDQKNYVKLSDFGLARKGNKYRMKECRKLPTKWLSPESLQKFVYYKSSDVYTYGILLYEIYTCSEPYLGLKGGEAKKKILSGEFPDFQKFAPSQLYDIVKKKIFLLEHKKRAPMKEIVQILESWLEVELVLENDDAHQENGSNTLLPSDRDDKTLPTDSKPLTPRQTSIRAKKDNTSVDKKASTTTTIPKPNSKSRSPGNRRSTAKLSDNQIKLTAKSEKETEKKEEKVEVKTNSNRAGASSNNKNKLDDKIVEPSGDLREMDEIMPSSFPGNKEQEISPVSKQKSPEQQQDFLELGNTQDQDFSQ